MKIFGEVAGAAVLITSAGLSMANTAPSTAVEQGDRFAAASNIDPQIQNLARLIVGRFDAVSLPYRAGNAGANLPSPANGVIVGNEQLSITSDTGPIDYPTPEGVNFMDIIKITPPNDLPGSRQVESVVTFSKNDQTGKWAVACYQSSGPMEGFGPQSAQQYNATDGVNFAAGDIATDANRNPAAAAAFAQQELGAARQAVEVPGAALPIPCIAP